MAICYVAHRFGGDHANLERAKKITHDLQMENPAHCFICPLLTFSHMKYGEMSFEDEMELCKDILSVSDYLIVTSEASKGVQIEIDFARMVGMEVIDLAEKYRSI
jgi:hypothetical protein